MTSNVFFHCPWVREGCTDAWEMVLFAQRVFATINMNLFVSATNALDLATWLHIDHRIQHQDMADALDCAHWQITDSSSVLADTHYYLDSTTVSSMIVDKFRNYSVTK